MESIVWMIDEAMKVWPTKTAIARHLGVTPQRLNDWERGYRHMPPEKIEALAALSGLAPALQIGRYELEWRKKRATSALAGIAALVCSLVVSGAALGPSTAEAQTIEYREPVPANCTLCEILVAWMRRILRRLAGLAEGNWLTLAVGHCPPT